MIIGIDMGGTNIDGVLIKDKKIKKTIKNPVDRSDLFGTIYKAIKELVANVDKSQIKRINLSTTISTNSIVESKIDHVLMIIQSGPGIQNNFAEKFEHVEEISGYVDHRGKVVKDLDWKEIEDIKDQYRFGSLESMAIITKFSTRNPQSEIRIKEEFADDFKYISLGHQLSGSLNFPRRVNTAYLNSAVAKVFSNFLYDMEAALALEGIEAPIYILKADGGTMDFSNALLHPVQSILSGPAASFMGITALDESSRDSIYLDIGGTTTDIFFLVDGYPIFEPVGIEIDGRKTLVRSIFSHSMGLGGDSVIRLIDGEISIGPERLGPPMALGGDNPTVTDAMKLLKLIDFGYYEKAKKGIKSLADSLDLCPEDFSENVLKKSAYMIFDRVEKLLSQINSRPLYTVREVLSGRKLEPKEIKIIGGPAEVLAPYIEKRFDLRVRVTENYQIANAIGAALSKPTFEINLHADTMNKILSIPEENIYKNISPRFNAIEAREIVMDLLENKSETLGKEAPQAEIVEENVFNMVDGWSMGKNIRIKGQIRPGLVFKIRGDRNES